MPDVIILIKLLQWAE